jgi:hypothetical protein
MKSLLHIWVLLRACQAPKPKSWGPAEHLSLALGRPSLGLGCLAGPHGPGFTEP